MSDLDSELRGLREELTAAIPLPDIDHFTGRARDRRKLQVGAIVAVIVVVAAVPIARALPVWMTTAKPDPAKTSYILDFADADHGYALTRTCEQGTEDCESTLYRTGDGGETWQPKRLPPAPGDGFWDVMYVLGPDEVSIANPLGVETTRIFSTDGGQSWGVTDSLSSGSTAPLASGGMLTGACGAQPYGVGGCQVIGSIQPVSGRFVAAPGQPALSPLQVGPSPTEGGKWWVAGSVDGNEHAFLAVSGDNGRAWFTSEMDMFAGPGGWAVVEHGNVMYATASNFGHLFGVWRSTNGGRSWTRTWGGKGELAASASGDSDVKRPGWIDDPVVADDGSIVLSDGAATWVSHDRGHTFTRGGEVSGWVKWTRAGYLRTQGRTFALSTDGTHWREFTVG